MAKYLIGYIDEKEGERIDFANLITQEDMFEVVMFDVNQNTSLDNLIEEILASKIHCIVVDYHLSDIGVQFEGNEIIERIHKIRPHFPKIIYTAKEDKVIPEVENEIMYMINDKSIKTDTDRSRNFRHKLKALIDNYNEDISKANETLQKLKEKKRMEPLNIDEENQLFIAKKFLMSIDTRIIDIHEVLEQKAYIDELHDANKKVNEILSKYRKA
ncbi:hypothetical protein [Flavobacterium sp. DG2-3]|uniref:hypothetical protein n=1 Tax=Flavobacterium sp. DG2-3 TaxID=3068317 RepID=UPI00273D9FF6|nr:hypothetical protein [Flavobacterium sp. DG2-3]MDP5202355.1 hypothetical protein [Flavobacterium sp. DG2-3]